MYKELDQIIDEYVGVEPVEQMEFNDKGETSYPTDYVSVDKELRDRIGDEITRHLAFVNGRESAKPTLDFKSMCPEAQKCFREWEDLMQSATEGGQCGSDNRNNY